MKLVKTIVTTINADDFMQWTDYQTDEDFIVYAVERLDINYMSLLLDEKTYTDYSIIYKAHNFFTVRGERIGIGVRLEWGDYNDACSLMMEVYK